MFNHLDYLDSHAFASAPMERRRQLARMLNGYQKSVTTAALLDRKAADNLNAGFWRD